MNIYVFEVEMGKAKPTTFAMLAKKEREILKAKKQKAEGKVLKALGLRRVK